MSAVSEDQNVAEWWADGWTLAYKRRANGYFNKMPPPDVYRKMVYARKRSDIAFDREQAWRDKRSEVTA